MPQLNGRDVSLFAEVSNLRLLLSNTNNDSIDH